MPSSKVKPANMYPAYWHRALEWLAEQPLSKTPSIAIAEKGEFTASLATVLNKLHAFRKACLADGAYIPAPVVRMLAAGEVKFSLREERIIAIRQATAASFLQNLKGLKK